jgi:hypothetical protein
VFEAGWGSDDPVVLGRLVPRVGGIAQLGEHLLCKQGVIGSIPIVSTTPAFVFKRGKTSATVQGDNRC